MAKTIKRKNTNNSVNMTISEANAHNAMTPNNAFMIGIGTEENPEFLYPEELEPAIVKASIEESRKKQSDKIASTFRDRSLIGHIGAGLDQNLGDKSLQNIAALSIGVPLVATNPAIAPITNTIKHTGKVLLDPTKALTGFGQAAATTADIYGTIQGLRQIPGAINNIKQGNGTGIDYFNLVTGAIGPFGTFNTIKGIKNINSFKHPLFDYNAYKTDMQIANNNYRIAKTNVPQSVTESFDNNSYAYNYLLYSNNYLKAKDVNKLRYFISKSISKYNPVIQKDILEDSKLLDDLAASYRAYGDSKNAQYHIDLVISQKFGVNGDFPKSIEDVYFNDPKRYQAITKIIKPLEEKVDKINASRISKLRPSLQQMVEVAPNYLDEIEEYANLGLDDETIAKKILEQRFTFYRGFATDNDISPQNLIQIPIKSSAGRADIQIFGKLEENEDIGYLSNSLETAIAYAYPKKSESPSKIVGLIKRRPESFNFEGNPIDWIKNNTLEEANIKRAISTHNLKGDVLDNFIRNLEKYGVTNLNFRKYETNRFLQELYDRVNDSKLNDNYFSHFLIKGNKGEYYKNLYIDELNKIPYIHDLYDLSELEKIFNRKLNRQSITRFHYGVSSPKTSKFKYGGMKENKIFKLKGGVAIPLDDKNKLFYLSGAKHEQGGIDVTPELEAEGGEVVKVNPKSIKVVTAQKIMGGKSPAELVVDASSTGKSDAVFNKVFNYQEEFKDRFGLNDDGTRKAKFGKFIKDGYNKFIKWLNSDSEIDPTQKGGYAKSSEDRRFEKSKEYDPTGHLYIDSKMNPSASSEQQGYYREYLGLDSDIPKMNPKAKTEWDDKVEAEKIKNGELPSDFYGTTPRMDVSIQAIADTLNTGNIYRNYDKFKKLHPELPSKDIIKDIYDAGKRILNEPNKWHGVNGDDLYIRPNPDKYTYSETNPLGMLRNFGMKWNPEKGKIFMHDTYDFPGIYTGKGRPMFNRPKEMKIRGAIDFNPKKGSYLLRNDMENYDNFPKPITVDRNVLKLGGNMKKKAIFGLEDVSNKSKTTLTNATNKVTQLNPKMTLAPRSQWNITGNDVNSPLTGYDWANIGVNTLGSLLTFGHALGNAKVNPLKYSDPIPYTGAKLKTRVNINSGKQKIKRATDKINDSINKNTSNSTVALNRLRNTYLNERDALVDLYTNKENTENQLINKDILNWQNARFKTINDYNTVRRENEKNRYLAERETQENINNAISGFVQNIGNATSSIANTLEQRDQFDKNMKILGLAYPNLDVERLNKVIRPTNIKKTERNRKREKVRLIRKGIIKPSEI